MWYTDINALIERYFRKNPIYYLDAIRFERQKLAARRNDETLVSDRWIQFWGVVITLLMIPFGYYITGAKNLSDESGVWIQIFGLIIIESVFMCSLMIAVIWEGFNSFAKDMEGGVFETILGTLLEPSKIVWGKFMHVFIHFLRFILVGFIFMFIVSPAANINPTLILVLLGLNLAVGCFLISNRIYRSAREALAKVHGRNSKDAGVSENSNRSEQASLGKKLLGWIDRGLVFAVIAFAFIQVQMVLVTNYFGDMSYYPRVIASIIGAHPLMFVIYLQMPLIAILLITSAWYQKKTEKLLKDFV
ncbi:MAG: hypothetical protein LWY06_10785 [Firmicutes bacterium]|nr:hypothetical protein [Bacillota bacterium]